MCTTYTIDDTIQVRFIQYPKKKSGGSQTEADWPSPSSVIHLLTVATGSATSGSGWPSLYATVTDLKHLHFNCLNSIRYIGFFHTGMLRLQE